MKVRDLLLKALGHGDCVSREHQRAEYRVRSAYLTERDEAEADTERLREALIAAKGTRRRYYEALQRITNGPAPGENIGWEWGAGIAFTALSADAEPCDCEPIRYPLHLSNSWTYTWEHQPDCATQKKES